MGKKRPAAESRGDPPKRFKGDGKQHGSSKRERGSKKSLSGGGQKHKSNLVFQPRPDWHAAELPSLPAIDNPTSPPQSVIQALQAHATSLLDTENARYSESNLSQSSSHKFLKDIMASGTLEDKVSALTLVVQESPVHTMKAFDNLLGLSRKKNRNQAIMALGALKDLLGSGVVLPPERKLRAFGRQPALTSALQGANADWKTGDELLEGLQEVHLVSWAFEDWLKRTYFEILKVLEGWCNDEVAYARNRAVTFVWELLKEKPEQEENLLRLLVNKLGDTDRKVASRASHLLLQLQVTHPLMKSIIIGAIESDLLFRSGQSPHAKYYAIITLNQTILSHKEQEVATKLLDIYFSLFVILLKNEKYGKTSKDDANGKIQGGGGKPGKKARQKAKLQEAASESEDQFRERMIAQVLTGVNRAYPFADANDTTVEAHLDTLYRITHSANFNTSVQALMLIQQISTSKQYTADRYYRTLYESLLDPRLLTSSKQIMYLNLLYRSLKSDLNIKRVKAFVKRLLQIITLHEPPFACGVLYLIHELTTEFPSIKSMLSEPEANDDDGEERFVDVPEDGAEPNIDEPAAANHADSPNPYDPRKRNPEHSNADRSCLWELIPLLAHQHPSVSLFSSRLLNSESMDQKPDPTTFTLIHFLDRFVYRNARSKASGLRGSSIMQPLAGAATADLLIKERSGGREEEPLNSEQFWAKKRDEVRPDEVFFHQYFAKAGKKKSRAEKRADQKKGGSDVDNDEDDEGTDEEEEKEIWKALVGSRPEIEGAESEDDIDLGDFMDDDEDEEDGGVDLDAEGGVIFHGFSGDEEEEDLEDAGPDGEVVSDDGLDLAALEDGDEAAFVGSDEELPMEFVSAFPVSDDEKEKEKDGRGKGKKKKRILKSLPTFASAEDYAKLLGDDDDDGNM